MLLEISLVPFNGEPEHGDVYIDSKENPATGLWKLVFMHPSEHILKTIPLQYATSLCVKEFLPKCSSHLPPHFILKTSNIKHLLK